MKLPTIAFNLREWHRADFQKFRQNSAALSKLATDAGKTSDRFRKARQIILNAALSGTPQKVPELILSTTDVRAATDLLASDREFVKSGALNQYFLQSLLGPRPQLSRLSLLQLVRAFLVFFTDLGSVENVKDLAEFIKTQMVRHEGLHEDHGLFLLSNNRDLIFGLYGPGRIVTKAFEDHHTLEEQFNLLSLTGYGNGVYQRICRYQYYFETLKQIDVGSNHEILKEITRPEVYNAPGSEEGMLGHEALKILIDRSDAKQVSESWQNTILSIAGDPRVPKSSSRYQKWWALLGEDRVNKVRGWFSRLDLRLFFQILENYGQDNGGRDHILMFPARRRFLEGLLEQGLVVNSRLFVGNQVCNYLERNFVEQELPEYALVRDSDRCMIYLLVGHCHMIEGSHNYKLWIFPKLPSGTVIENYSDDKYDPRDLGHGILDRYNEEFGSSAPKPIDIIHHPPFAWQHKAISFLESQGIRLDVEQLFSSGDYQRYVFTYGLKSWG